MENEHFKPQTEQPCPGCGDPAPCETWDKNGYRFQSLDCIKCGVAWGRIVDRDGTWHVLWPIGPDGLRIWPGEKV